MKQLLLAAVAFAFLVACDPPGKPQAEELPALQVTDFKILYAQNCSGCHGPDGQKGPGRILNDSVYLSVIPRDTLQHIIEYGREGTAMPAWALSEGGPLTPQQVDALVNGIESWKKPVSAPPGAELPGLHLNQRGRSGERQAPLWARLFCLPWSRARVGSVTDPSYLTLPQSEFAHVHHCRAHGFGHAELSIFKRGTSAKRPGCN